MNVPTGWKLVPASATKVMLDATISCYPGWVDASAHTIKQISHSVYLSMLDAAPNCGACPGDGTVCAESCKLGEESPVAAAPAPAVVQAEVSELPPLPESSLWMTHESHYRLKDGGNCKGAVPVHGKPSSTAKLPLYTADQMRAYATAARGVL